MKGRVIEREEKKEKQERSLMRCFTPQVVAAAGLGSSQSQESGAWNSTQVSHINGRDISIWPTVHCVTRYISRKLVKKWGSDRVWASQETSLCYDHFYFIISTFILKYLSNPEFCRIPKNLKLLTTDTVIKPTHSHLTVPE